MSDRHSIFHVRVNIVTPFLAPKFKFFLVVILGSGKKWKKRCFSSAMEVIKEPRKFLGIKKC